MFDSTFLYQLDRVNSLFALNRDLQNNYSFLRDYIFEIIIEMTSLEAWISNFNKYLNEYIKQEYEI